MNSKCVCYVVDHVFAFEGLSTCKHHINMYFILLGTNQTYVSKVEFILIQSKSLNLWDNRPNMFIFKLKFIKLTNMDLLVTLSPPIGAC